jgi:hypothetical protein
MRMAGVRAEVPKPWVMKILQWVASPQKKHKNWYGVCLYLQIYVCLQNNSRIQYKCI